ncbi:MAG TPA: TadE/TadG family protein [Syntrophales bacterium]|nr:TadE/TadG family protein [Syntrophales bacterium]HQL90633.1 TadE/TadG family protein [Syntrophales bacterium]
MKESKRIVLKIAGIRVADDRGAFAVIFALVLLVLLGFTALGIEAGRWYLVRAELAKGVDAGALVAAKNISNPYVDPVVIAREFAEENFRAGYIGTPDSGEGQVQFSAQMLENNRVSVRGDVNATAHLARLFGVNTIPVSAIGVAQRRDVEIMLILDRSGSMAGQKMTDLKRAANSFLDFFVETQAEDRVGLISFATTVTLDRPLGSDFVDEMRSAISAMTAVGATNTEDAIDRAGGAGSFTDQSALPGDRRVQQFAVFFSDGMPTALRERFRYNGQEYDGVAYGVGSSGHANCRTTDYPYMSVYSQLHRPTGTNSFYPGVNPATTGDGRTTSGSDATNCCCPRYLNTKWYIFESQPVPGYTAEQCSIPMNRLLPHFCSLTRQLALQNAQTLKNRGVKIYAVGLGSSSEIDPNFLRSLSSGESYTYIAPTSSELEAIFIRIARDIKLRLVQ